MEAKMLTDGLSVNNYREHSLFLDFQETEEYNECIESDCSEYEIFENFLTYLEEL